MGRAIASTLAGLFLTASPVIGATNDRPLPDRDMLKMIDFLRQMEIIQNMEMMQDLHRLESAGSAPQSGSERAASRTKKEKSK